MLQSRPCGRKELALENVARDFALLSLSYLSWKTTRQSIRIENAFTWTPIHEVATVRLFHVALFYITCEILILLRTGATGQCRQSFLMSPDSDVLRPAGMILPAWQPRCFLNSTVTRQPLIESD